LKARFSHGCFPLNRSFSDDKEYIWNYLKAFFWFWGRARLKCLKMMIIKRIHRLHWIRIQLRIQWVMRPLERGLTRWLGSLFSVICVTKKSKTNAPQPHAFTYSIHFEK
jgi:hypothetical protein